MPTIADHLERAAEELARPTTAPTPGALRQVSERRRRRRRNTVVGAAAIGTIAAAGLASFRPSPTQHVEAVDTTETTQLTGLPVTTTSTTPVASEPWSELAAWMASRPWEDRTFLVPPDTDIYGFGTADDSHSAWGSGFAPSGDLFLYPAADGPVDGSYVRISVVRNEANEFSVDHPVEWEVEFAERPAVEADDRPVTVDVGSSRDGGYVEVHRSIGVDVLIVEAVGLSEAEAIELSMSARLDGSAPALADVPPGLEVETAGSPPPTSTSYSLIFEPAGQTGYRLGWSDRPLSAVVLERSVDPDAGRQAVTVRRTRGIVQSGTSADPSDLPVLIWEEPGVGVFTLEVAWAPLPTADDLVALAETLRSTSYADVIDRLDGPTGFFEQRPETIAGWLEATPLPGGWDPRPLIATPPMGRHDTASLVSRYTQCAWLSEFRRAVASADDAARAESLDVLSQWLTWPATEAWMEERLAAASDPERMSTDIVSSHEDHLAVLSAVTDAADLEAPEIADCGFVPPADR